MNSQTKQKRREKGNYIRRLRVIKNIAHLIIFFTALFFFIFGLVWLLMEGNRIVYLFFACAVIWFVNELI